MLKAIDKIFEVIGVLLMATICCTVFTGVFFRYVLNSPLGWIEEVARYALVWVTYIGAYLAMRRSRHLSIDIIHNRLSARGKKILSVVGLLVMLPFFIVLIFVGIRYGRSFIDQRTPYLELPLGYIYFILPVIGILFVTEIAFEIFKQVKGQN